MRQNDAGHGRFQIVIFAGEVEDRAERLFDLLRRPVFAFFDEFIQERLHVLSRDASQVPLTEYGEKLGIIPRRATLGSSNRRNLSRRR